MKGKISRSPWEDGVLTWTFYIRESPCSFQLQLVERGRHTDICCCCQVTSDAVAKWPADSFVSMLMETTNITNNCVTWNTERNIQENCSSTYSNRQHQWLSLTYPTAIQPSASKTACQTSGSGLSFHQNHIECCGIMKVRQVKIPWYVSSGQRQR